MNAGLGGSAGVIVLIAALVFFSQRRLGGTRIQAADGVLRTEPIGFDKLWSFKAHIDVPLASVRDVRVEDCERQRVFYFRWPGTHIPFWIMSGTYLGGGRRSFYNVHRARRVLVIELGGVRYDRIVVEVDDPDVVAASIRDAARSGR
jgi:hypothetical protein